MVKGVGKRKGRREEERVGGEKGEKGRRMGEKGIKKKTKVRERKKNTEGKESGK